jgi:hypothetical protein
VCIASAVPHPNPEPPRSVVQGPTCFRCVADWVTLPDPGSRHLVECVRVVIAMNRTAVRAQVGKDG